MEKLKKIIKIGMIVVGIIVMTLGIASFFSESDWLKYTSIGFIAILLILLLVQLIINAKIKVYSN